MLKAALSSYIFIEFRRYSRGEKTILGKDVIQMHFVFEKTRAFLDDVGIFESELRYQDEISRSKAIEAGFVQPDAEPDDQAILYTDEAKAAKANAWVLFADPKHCIVDLLNFFGDRLKVQQRDKGVRHDLIDAVFAKGDDDLVRILNRVAALSAFLESDDGANLLAGYKRAANILKIEEKKDGVSYDKPVEVGKLAATEAEALSGALASAKEAAENALISEDFEGAMAALSGLRAPLTSSLTKSS